MCCWLGPAHQTGQSFCSYILKPNGQFLARSTVVPIPDNNLHTDELKTKTKVFMNCLNELIGNAREPLFNLQDAQEIYYTNFGDDPGDDENDLPYGTELLDLESSEMDENYIEATNECINAQVVIPNKEGIPVLAKKNQEEEKRCQWTTCRRAKL